MTLLKRPLCFLVFLLLFLFGHVLEAANLERRLPPQGELRVRLDYTLATHETASEEALHRWVWSSYIVFNGPVSSITKGQLRSIAQDAHAEMIADMGQYKPRKKGVVRPSVMTIVAFDNKIILSSSQKGWSGFLNDWPDSPVNLALDRCSSVWRDRANTDPEVTGNPDLLHRNQAKCGEVNAFFQYYMTHSTPLSELDPKARVTTVIVRVANTRFIHLVVKTKTGKIER